MSRPISKFYAIGTLSLDFLKIVESYEPGLKVPAKSRRQLGGVGFNALSTALYTTTLFGGEAEGILCTKLGPDHFENDLRTPILNRLKAHPTMKVFDVARHDVNFSAPDFPVILDQSAGDRFIPIAKNTSPSLPLSSEDKKQIAQDVATSDLLILTSRMIDETLVAVRSAKANGTKVILDFNFEDPSFANSPHLLEIIESADILVIPSETITTPHHMYDFKMILNEIIKKNEHKLIGVSNGACPIIIYNQKKLSNFALPKLFSSEVDSLAAGDNRTGATAAMVALGLDYRTSLVWGSTVSAFSLNYFGQTWQKEIKGLFNFCTAHLGSPPRLNIDSPVRVPAQRSVSPSFKSS